MKSNTEYGVADIIKIIHIELFIDKYTLLR